MVDTKKLSLQARIPILAVILSGTILGVQLVSRVDLNSSQLLPLVVFCGFGVLAAAMNISRRSTTHSRLSHQIGSSFAYPLLVLVEPGAACVAFVFMTLADKFLHRRGWVTTGFNVGQLTLACGAAVLFQNWIRPGFSGLDRLDGRTLAAAGLSIVVFALVNHGLTRGVVSLVNGHPLFRWDWFTRTGLLNETLCLVSGLGMAVLWRTEPWLVLLGAVPVWVMGYLIATLSRREAALETRENELRLLQGLGLEIGSELEIDRLRESVLTIASEALEATGGLLARVDPERLEIDPQAWRGLETDPPSRVALEGVPKAFFERGEIELVGEQATVERFPGFAFLDASGMLLAPLRIQGESSGLLLLFHDEKRLPFGEGDRRRLETLVPFVNVALSNARLVSERKSLQAQLLQADKMSAMGVLVAGVAHELNNPLTSVLGYAELLRAGEQDAKRKEKLEKIGRQAKRAAEIVRSLRMFSRESKPEKKPVSLNRVIEQVLEFRTEELSALEIDIEPRLASQLPPVVANIAQLQQVFLELISNAQRAVGQVECRGRIVIETTVSDGTVRAVVSDNGRGVRPEHADQIFLPFFTSKDVGHGPGLGLSICYGIVKEHGGRIHTEPGPGGGAAFFIDIPSAEEVESTPESHGDDMQASA